MRISELIYGYGRVFYQRETRKECKALLSINPKDVQTATVSTVSGRELSRESQSNTAAYAPSVEIVLASSSQPFVVSTNPSIPTGLALIEERRLWDR